MYTRILVPVDGSEAGRRDEQTTARAADTLIEQAGRQRCDLIVMGTHGRRGRNRVHMGSDAELVLLASSVPVLLVRQPT